MALLFVVGAGEIGLALQLAGLVDLVGVELFLTLFFGGVLWRFELAVSVVRTALERLDPFFFVPTRSQIAACSTLLVHAVPWLVTLCLVGYTAAELSPEWTS